MSVEVLVIGIGSGDPGHLTGEAAAAIRRVDLFLVADKGEVKSDLVTLRTALVQGVRGTGGYRVVEVPDPERGPDAQRDTAAYTAGVRDWHAARAARYAEVIRREVGPDGVVGFLVWGDPAFYDSTLRIVDSVAEHGVDLTTTVLPGISSLQLLAARHRLVLNGVGGSVHVTTGRRLLVEYRADLGDVVVMLDGTLTCARLLDAHPDLKIFWGAQLGLADEALVAGRLADVLDEIRSVRLRLRAERGWVMDTYLLRPGPASEPPG
ncbi:precorrin-6A synthase (deacetylating) [Microlunatus capsulatus]|uniref:Precorrin-6A synthase n=1 Tax=Microlunatus capsulatus TaxID=99117 RepID=A0ABS4Z8S7_9ACTN|nr:precorrin-6A synthase (deacetylating) [Microlunatus capsulatus]MBP2417117.1 precorrin-6A synthase [Microlunatus capsulatus]